MHQAQQKTAAELEQEIAELSALVNEHKQQLREAAAGSEEHTALTKLLNKEKPKLGALEYKLRGQKAVEAAERAEREKTQAEETARAEKQGWMESNLSGMNETQKQDFDCIIDQIKIWIAAKKFTPKVVHLSPRGNYVLNRLIFNRNTRQEPVAGQKLLKSDYKFLYALAEGGAGARVWLVDEILEQHKERSTGKLWESLESLRDEDAEQRISDLAELFAEANKDFNEKDLGGQTALHHARSALVARLLIENGANVHAQDKDGKKPLHTGNLSEQHRQVLIDAGAE